MKPLSVCFGHNKNLWAPQTCAHATLRQSVANLMFHNVSFNLLLLYQNLTPSLRTTVPSELVCTKNVFYPILLIPTYLPQASSPLERSRQTEGQNSSPPVT